MIRERDAYFSKRFGPEYIARLKSLQSTGVDLTSILETAAVGSERDEYLPDPTALPLPSTGNTLARSRKAHAADQMSRAGGISITSMSQLRAVLGDQADKLGHVFQNAPPGYEARMMALPVTGGIGGAREQVGYDGYDTDQESGGRKRRKRRYSPERIDTESEPSIVPVSEPSHKKMIPVIGQKPPSNISGSVRTKENKVVESPRIAELSTPGTGSVAVSLKKTTTVRATPRFFVDKDHLRALAQVGDEEG